MLQLTISVKPNPAQDLLAQTPLGHWAESSPSFGQTNDFFTQRHNFAAASKFSWAQECLSQSWKWRSGWKPLLGQRDTQRALKHSLQLSSFGLVSSTRTKLLGLNLGWEQRIVPKNQLEMPLPLLMGSLPKPTGYCGVLQPAPHFGIHFMLPYIPTCLKPTKPQNICVFSVSWAFFWHLTEHIVTAGITSWFFLPGMAQKLMLLLWEGQNIVTSRDNVSNCTSNMHLNSVSGTHFWLNPSSYVHPANPHLTCHIWTM